jgi:hypothetical protein
MQCLARAVRLTRCRGAFRQACIQQLLGRFTIVTALPGVKYSRMATSTLYTEARRWVKFPATVLVATALLWLLRNFFDYDQVAVGQRAESVIGAIFVFFEFVLIPLGSVAVAVGMLWLQRWALYLGYVMPLLPLIVVSLEQTHRVAMKFAAWRATGEFSSFGAGVMTALLVAALWAVYGLMVLYIFKSTHLLGQAQEWLHAPDASLAGKGGLISPLSGGEGIEEGDCCLLMPDGSHEETI